MIVIHRNTGRAHKLDCDRGDWGENEGCYTLCGMASDQDEDEWILPTEWPSREGKNRECRTCRKLTTTTWGWSIPK